ncbi:hypothetical protein RJ035_001738 [Blastomyces gilchristii]
MGDKRKRSQLLAEDDAVEVAEVKQKKPKKSDKERKGDKSKKERKEKTGKKQDDEEVQDNVEVNGLGTDAEMKDIDEAIPLVNGTAGEEAENKAKEAKKGKKEKKEKKEKEKKENKEKKVREADEVVEERQDKKKKKKEKKEKKEKRKDKKDVEGKDKLSKEGEEKGEGEQEAVPGNLENQEKKKSKKSKDKKEKKRSKDKKDKEGVMLPEHGDMTEKPAAVETDAAEVNSVDKTIEGTNGHDEEKKSQRFIVFIGNLPFQTTLEAVQKHFAKIDPSHVRLPSEKGGKKGRGFAFIEFDHYDRMKTCLKLYHHSLFDDGKNPARKINVELTAGGGGSKSETRKARIVEKNTKLSEQRARAAKEALKQKNKADAAKPADDAEAAPVKNDMDDVHPTRRRWVPGP